MVSKTHTTLSIRNLFVIPFFILAYLLSVASFAKENVKYGPTRGGETLWKIAEKNISNKSISVEQLVYAIYRANPNAFNSGNINLLSKGVTLVIPSDQNITAFSKTEAKGRIGVLHSQAKKQAVAKTNTRKFSKQIKIYKRQLRKHRRKSGAWRKVYRKLTRSKRNYAISKRKEAHFSKLILDGAKANPLVMSISKRQIAETNKMLQKFTNKEDKVATKTADAAKQSSEIKKLAPETAQDRKVIKPQVAKGNLDNDPKNTKQAKNEQVSNTTRVLVANGQALQTQQAFNQQQDNQQNKQQQNKQQQNNQVKPSLLRTLKDTNWLDYFKNNFILIGGVINGIILFFVLIKLFERKDEEDDIYA